MPVRSPGHRLRPFRHGHGRGQLRGGLGLDTTTTRQGPSQVFPVDVDGVPGTLGIEVYISPGADPLADPSTYAWERITPWVLYEHKIRIRRGLEDEQGLITPATCALSLKNYNIPDAIAPYNVDGLFTERNPYGPWYGRLGPNTPLRVDINIGLGDVRRFTGFVTAWPPASDRSGNFKYIKIVAEDVLRRLGQGDPLVESAATNLVQSINAAPLTSNPVIAWYPLEDAAGTTDPGSGLSGGDPLSVAGTVTFSSVTPPPGVLAAPNISAGSMEFSPPYSATGTETGTGAPKQWSVGCYFQTTGDCDVIEWDLAGGGTIAVYVISGTLRVVTSAGDTMTLTGATPAVDYADGEWHNVRVTAGYLNATQTLIGARGDDGATLLWDSNSMTANVAVSPISRVFLNRFMNANCVSITHVTTTGKDAAGQASIDPNTWVAMMGNPGTRTSANWTAALSGTGLYSTSVQGTNADRALMGTYPTGTVRQALDDCVAAERGWMHSRISGRLGFDDHTWRENRPVTIHLGNGEGYRQLASFDPVPDDQYRINDATVKRLNGSQRRYAETEGRRGTVAVGTYPSGGTLNLYRDDAALFAASSIVNRGTVDEERYPLVVFELHRPINAAVAVEWLGDGGDPSRGSDPLGRRMTIANPSPDLPPGTVDLQIIGYVEEFDQLTLRVEAVCVPNVPYLVASASGDADGEGGGSEFLGFAVPDTCVLAEDLDVSEVEVDITTDPLWSVDPVDWSTGPTVTVDGEDMRVWGVSGASNPQTLTVTRSANGVSLTHDAGADLVFKYPGVAGL